MTAGVKTANTETKFTETSILLANLSLSRWSTFLKLFDCFLSQTGKSGGGKAPTKLTPSCGRAPTLLKIKKIW